MEDGNMEATRTYKERHTLTLSVSGGAVLDAGLLLQLLDAEVEKHPRDERYVSSFAGTLTMIPPTAGVEVDASGVTLTWTDDDEDAYQTAYADEKLKRDADAAAHQENTEKETA
jgi:hypothetical protein